MHKKLEYREEPSKEVAARYFQGDSNAQDSNQPAIRIRRGVYRFAHHFFVKVAHPRISPVQKGRNMLFAQQATRIPVATVYALLHDEESGLEILIQEYIPGEDLEAFWKRLDQQGKDAMLATPRGYFDDLRRIPSRGYFGSPWRQPTIQPFVFSQVCGPGVDDHGPCQYEEQWIELMIRAAIREHPLSEVRIEFERILLHSVLLGHPRPVFTHGDFGWDHVRVRSDGVVFLKDWKSSGGIRLTGNSVFAP